MAVNEDGFQPSSATIESSPVRERAAEPAAGGQIHREAPPTEGFKLWPEVPLFLQHSILLI